MAKTSKVRTRKRGKTWSYAFEAGIVNGKRKAVEKGGFATEPDAYEAGIEAYNSWKHGDIGVVSGKIQVVEYLDRWLEYKSQEVRASTLQNYTYAIHQVKPYFSGRTMQDVTPAVADAWIHAAAAKGLSHGTLKRYRSILSDVFKHAVYPAKIISENPFSYIKIPNNAPRNVVERTIITREHLQRIIKRYPYEHIAHIPIMINYYTGMRMGEICGLEWKHIDLKNRIIHVVQQVTIVKKATYITPPKSDAGTRDIPIDKKLAALLKDWKADMRAYQLEAGSSFIISYIDKNGTLQKCSKALVPAGAEIHDFVCTNTKGRKLSTTRYVQILNSIGLNSHSFRHTHATRLSEAGASVKGIAARIGHSDTHLTEKLYMHTTDRLQADTLQKFINDGM